MENDVDRPTWPDLEATVAKNARRLREAQGLSQLLFGALMVNYGLPMHQTTVAKLEAGSKPLRLNEVAALAAFFEVPVESLWETGDGVLNAYQLARRAADIERAKDQLGDARAVVQHAAADESKLSAARDDALERLNLARAREASSAAQLRALQGYDDAQH